MKTPRLFRRAEFRSALLFLVLSSVWILVTNLVFQPDLTSDIILICVMAILIYFGVRASRKKLVRMTKEYKSLFETHPSPMWIFNTATLQFLAVNEAAIRHYGYSREEFLSMTILDIRPQEDIKKVEEVLADTSSRFEHESIWRHLTKNGKEITVKIISNDVTFNKCKARLIEVNDITEMLTQEQTMRQMSLVAENTSNAVILSDAEGRIEWVNRAFEQITGYTLAEVKGKFPRSFLHGAKTDKKTESLIIEQARQQKNFVGDIINYKKDGSPYWIHLNLSPIVRNGKTENIVVIQTDITELKQQAEKISNQYKQLRDVAFMTTHNARSQLTNILGLCDIIDYQGTDPELKKLIGYLKESAVKLDETIHGIVSQASKIEPVDQQDG